jgi:hypothetical protein
MLLLTLLILDVSNDWQQCIIMVSVSTNGCLQQSEVAALVTHPAAASTC